MSIEIEESVSMDCLCLRMGCLGGRLRGGRSVVAVGGEKIGRLGESECGGGGRGCQ